MKMIPRLVIVRYEGKKMFALAWSAPLNVHDELMRIARSAVAK